MKAKSTTRTAVQVRVKVWLEIDSEHVFGRGICDILLAVQETGSIKDAAAQVGKSYRHVWARIKEAELAIGQPLVISRVGGKVPRRTELTPLATELVRDFVDLRGRMIELAGQQFNRRFASLH